MSAPVASAADGGRACAAPGCGNATLRNRNRYCSRPCSYSAKRGRFEPKQCARPACDEMLRPARNERPGAFKARRFCSRNCAHNRGHPVARFAGVNRPGDSTTSGQDETAWKARAACRNTDRPQAFDMPDAWPYPGPTPDAQQAARRYCAHCPVLDDCGALADELAGGADPVTGVWAGEWRTTTGCQPIRTAGPIGVPA